MVLALLVAVLWGVAFVATRIGLDELSPAQLAIARFAIAAAPVLVVARPRVPWPAIIAVGLTLFAGQFMFQFFGIAAGMPPGLASVVVQSQALFTIALAALFLGERPTSRQVTGVVIGAAGLAAIAMTIGGELSATALLLTLGSPVSFAVGNLLLKRLPTAAPFGLVAWLSLVPPIPALAVGSMLHGPHAVADVASLSWRGVVAALYLGAVATTLAYAMWGALLRRYPTALVAPFALLVPFVAAASSAAVFGERFGGLRLAGMALVLCGLAVIVVPGREAAA